jgi:hypothetical protein
VASRSQLPSEDSLRFEDRANRAVGYEPFEHRFIKTCQLVDRVINPERSKWWEWLTIWERAQTAIGEMPSTDFLKPAISASNKVRSARARVSSVTPRRHARQKQRQRRATRTVPFVPYRRFDPEVVQNMRSRPFAVD